MQDQNTDFVDWLNINEEEDLPTGTYRAQVIHTDDGKSQQSGKRMLRVGFNVIEPPEYAGIGHFENYVVGTDEQPEHYGKDTRGGRAFKKLCKMANVPDSNSITTLLQTVNQNEVMIAVRYNPESDFKNNVTNYFRVGERPASVAQTISKAPAPRPMPAGAPAQPPAPAVQPTAPAPVAPAPAQLEQAPQPVAAAPVAAPAPAAAPAPTPTPTPAPVAPAAPAPQVAPAPQTAPAPVDNAAAPSGPMMHCTICQHQIPGADFGAHVNAHATGAIDQAGNPVAR